MIWGMASRGERDAVSPGSGGASPYLRRAFPPSTPSYFGAYGLRPELNVQPFAFGAKRYWSI
jgi:hypothetical protein